VAAFSLVLQHQTKGMVELDQMIWAGIDHREPTPGAENSSRLGEILWREDTDYEIGGRIVHGPVGPQIHDAKRKAWPASRRPTRCGSRNVEP